MTKTKKSKTQVKVKSYTNQIEFKRGKDKKKRKRKSRRNEAIIAAASIGGGARIGGIHGFIRGRGGLGGSKTIATRYTNLVVKKGVPARKHMVNFLANNLKENLKDAPPGSDLKALGKVLNKRGRKMAMKHAAIGAGIGAAGYGGYRAIKALRNRKAKK